MSTWAIENPAPSEVHASALAAIPGYSSATQRAQRIEEWDGRRVRELNLEIQAERERLNAAVVAIADGEDVDLIGIARGIRALEADRDAEALITDFTVVTRSSVRASDRDLDMSDKNAALSHLNGMLRAVTAEVRELDATLRNVHTQSAAMRATPAELTSWQRLEHLVDIVTEIRESQRAILTAGGTLGHETISALNTTGLLADALDRERYWSHLRIRGAARLADGMREGGPTPVETAFAEWLAPGATTGKGTDVRSWTPWPSTEGSPWPVDDERAEYLRWISANATPWVPTTTQLQEAASTASRAAAGDLQAAHRYYAITGAKPLVPLPALDARHSEASQNVGRDPLRSRGVTVRPR